ncbi:MAG: proline--tRNA ligase [Deltaproteobacteria bacterium]|nr:proline--tRNA ligase [Deltaproteobacteria bacterium]
MRYSRALIPTLREMPSEGEVVSHQLMLRAGYIRQVARGIYNYLPLGWRVLQKISQIVREELDRVGCQEVQMPCVIPAELWEQSGRWQAYGKELLRLKDRHDRAYCFGPTHEEIITPLVASVVHSYKELPHNLYQIQTKFRDEIRPRFGLMRGREFLMKDAYSFHATDADLDREYEVMCAAYQRIFARCGLSSCVVEAATGSIGGRSSHEVMVLAETGESEVASCACGYAANVEMAEKRRKETVTAARDAASIPAVRKVHTPGLGGVDDVVGLLGLTAAEMIKTLIYLRDGGLVVALIPGDTLLNEHKLQTAIGADFVTLADEAAIRQLTGAAVGFAGPIGLPRVVEGIGAVTVVADHAIAQMRDAATGANETDYHVCHVVPGRDFVPDQYADLQSVVAGDPCPRCSDGRLAIMRGIEVGHLFKLGTKYAKPFAAQFLDQDGKAVTMTMGCYGLGIGRTAAAAIEQHHDDRGMLWPLPIAPYHVALLLLNGKNPEHRAYADRAYETLTTAGVEVLYDDRQERAGVKFADAELIGIPYQVVIGGKGVETGSLELKERCTGDARMMSLQDVTTTIHETLAHFRRGGPDVT